MAKKICNKCGNPEKMYYCNECESSCEEKECEQCGIPTKVDAKYHDNCNAPNKCIIIPVSENDAYDIINGETFNWSFPVEGSNEWVDVCIRLETDEDIDA